MNFYKNIFFLFILCITPIVLEAYSNEEINKATAFVSPGIRAIMMREAEAKDVEAHKLKFKTVITEMKLLNTAKASIVPSPSVLKRSTNNPDKTDELIASVEIEKIKAQKRAKIREIERISNYKLKALTGTALTTTVAGLLVAQKNIPQHRMVGIDDAIAVQFVSSILTAAIPMITTGLLIWKIESWIRSGDQAKIKAIKIEHTREIQEVLATMEKNKAEVQKALDKETADRKKADQDVKRESLEAFATTTHELERKVNDYKSKVDALSNHLEITQTAISNADNKISEIAPNVTTALNNTLELKSFMAMQIFPIINKIQSQIAEMREREENYIDPLADNIEHAIAQNTVENYPAGTPLTSGGHASNAIFTKKKNKNPEKTSGLTHTVTAGLSTITSSLPNLFSANHKK